MDTHTLIAINGRSVRVVRRSPSRDSRRTPAAGSPIRVERDCPPAPLVGLADLTEIDARVRRLTVRDEDSADIKIDLRRLIGRLKKRFRP